MDNHLCEEDVRVITPYGGGRTTDQIAYVPERRA